MTGSGGRSGRSEWERWQAAQRREAERQARGHGLPDRAADPFYPLVPSDPEFGGHLMTTDTHGHSDYWNLNTESLNNQAKVLTQTYANADPHDDPVLKDPPRITRN